MNQTEAIHRALKRLIRNRGRTYADAAGVLELSEASVKRLFSRGELSLQRMELLCDWLGVDIADVVTLSQEQQPLVTQLSPQQERELMADPSLLLVAFLLLNHWNEADILATFAFTRPELLKRLGRLSKLGLIELLPFDRIKLRAARNFAWRKDGPIQRFFTERVLGEFLHSRFDAPGEQMQFVGGMLSRASVLQLHASMQALARELDDCVTRDRALPVEERYGASLLLALRPWEFSEFTRLRRVARESW